MHNRPRTRPVCCLLLATLFTAGCATSPQPLDPAVRARLGKVYLHSAGPVHNIYFEAGFNTGGASGALKGAGKGAVDGLDRCLGSALGAGVLGPLVLAICAPLQVPVALVEGSTAGSQPAIAADTLASLEEQANSSLQSADLSGALVATMDEQSQTRPALAAHEISHGTLPAPADGESVADVAARWDYQTVLEIEVTEAGFEGEDGRVPMMHFSMTADIRLIDSASGKTLQRDEYRYDSQPQPYTYWFRDDYRLLASELVKANRRMANDILGNVFLK